MLDPVSSHRDLMPIGRFSRLANLSVHQLRHYHEVGLLMPAHVDEESGYRYYASPQVQVADLIALLRSLDLPLADIRRLLSSPDRGTVAEILDVHRLHLEERFRDAERRLQDFERFISEGILRMSIDIPRDHVPVRVTAVRQHPRSGQHVVILTTEDGARHLPIWIGPQEASGIALHLSNRSPQRPGSHDFVSSLATAAGVSVRAVTIWRPDDVQDLYVAAVELDVAPRTAVLDARPSDAINLALRLGAPIRVSAATFPSDRELAREAIRVRLVSEDGRRLGETEVFREPRPGDHVEMREAFEITAVRTDAEGAHVATARD